MERMTVKQFDRLKQVDFHNGAVLNEIRYSLGMLEELVALHGEAKELEGKKIMCTCHGLNNPYCPVHGIQVHDVDEFYKEQPDVWEAWVQRMPVNLINGHWGDDMQQWFREMVELIRKE